MAETGAWGLNLDRIIALVSPIVVAVGLVVYMNDIKHDAARANDRVTEVVHRIDEQDKYLAARREILNKSMSLQDVLSERVSNQGILLTDFHKQLSDILSAVSNHSGQLADMRVDIASIRAAVAPRRLGENK